MLARGVLGSHWLLLLPHYRPPRKISPGRLTTWITLILIVQAGDIELNPGPGRPNFPCDICHKAARWNQNCLQYKLCHGWFHASRLGMPDSLYQNHVENESLTWICSEFGMPKFWNLSWSLFGSTAATDMLDSAHNTPSATSHNTDTTTEEISVSSALTPDR